MSCSKGIDDVEVSASRSHVKRELEMHLDAAKLKNSNTGRGRDAVGVYIATKLVRPIAHVALGCIEMFQAERGDMLFICRVV